MTHCILNDTYIFQLHKDIYNFKEDDQILFHDYAENSKIYRVYMYMHI